MIHRISCPSRPEFRPDTLGVRAVLFSLGLVFWGSGCTPVAVTTAEPEPVAPSAPSIESGNPSTGVSAEARRALALARESLEAGDYPRAQDAARDVVVHYPSAEGSAEALAILAEAGLQVGELEEAVDASQRYLSLFPTDHPLFPGAVLLYGRVLDGNGDEEGSIRALFRMPPGTEDASLREGERIVRSLVRDIPHEVLVALAEDAASPASYRGIAASELAVSLFLGDQEDQGRNWAREALQHPLSEEDEALARGVLGGSLEGVLGDAIILGAVLPSTGVSPSLQEYGDLVLEGIQIAVAEYQAALRRPVRLEVLDHQGDPDRIATEVRALESMGAAGVVGPLSADFLRVAASSRSSRMPMVSPFSSLPPDEAEGIFSLSGPDPGGSKEVARYSWDLGLERVVILRPGTGAAEIDAEAFRSVFEELGGTISREIVFNPGATFFQSEFEGVGSVLPDGLFLPLTPRDVQLLAPQFTYYGLDTLGIQVLGTSGWTDEDILAEVDSRHTDGVIASTTRLSQDETEAYRRFRLQYEERFQKSLRTSIPAYGYDAAALLFQGLRGNPRTADELLRALGTLHDIPGATGHFSVVDGLVLRVPQLVRIQDRELIFISSHLH